MKLPCNCEMGFWKGHCVCCGRTIKPERFILKESIRWTLVLIICAAVAWFIAYRVLP